MQQKDINVGVLIVLIIVILAIGVARGAMVHLHPPGR